MAATSSDVVMSSDALESVTTPVKHFICPDCRNSYLSEMRLKKHRWIKHNGPTSISEEMALLGKQLMFVCPYCRYYVDRKGHFKDHLRRKHAHLYCNLDDVVHCNAKTLSDIAEQNISDQTKFTSTKGKPVTVLKQPMMKEEPNLLSCSFCSFKTKWYSAMRRHQRNLHQKVYRKRASCNTRSIESKTLLSPRHINPSVPADDHMKSYSCNICSEQCSSKLKLFLHARTHACLKPFKCKLCGHRTSLKHKLAAHLKTVHKTSLVNSLIICMSPSKLQPKLHSVSNVRRIQLVSGGTMSGDDRICEQFVCELCSDSFDTKVKLDKHVKTHFDSTIPEAKQMIDASAMKELSKNITNGNCESPSEMAVVFKRPMTARKSRRVVSSSESPLTPTPPSVPKQASLTPVIVTDSQSSEKNSHLAVSDAGALKKPKHISKPAEVKSLARNNLLRYKCSLCDYRSNWQSSMCRHRAQRHSTSTSTIIKLSIEEAQQSVSQYICEQRLKLRNASRLSHNPYAFLHRLGVGFKPYKCSSCSFRTNWLKVIKKHIVRFHDNAKIIRLNFQQAKESLPDYDGKCKINNVDKVSAYKRLFTKTSDALHTSSSRVHRRRKLSSCDPKGLRRFSCSGCYLRSNYRHAVVRHIKDHHNDGSCHVHVRILSENEAKASLQEYEASHTVRTVKASPDKMSNSSTSPCSKNKFVLTNMCDITKANNIGDVPNSHTENDQAVNKEKQGNPTTASYTLVDDVFICSICPYRAVREHHIESHQKMHIKRPGTNLQCSYCPYFTRNAHFLNQHLQLHEKPGDAKPVSTPSKTVKEKLQDNLPSPVSGDHSLLTCSICPYMSKWRNSMMYHRQLHRQRPSAKFKCQECPFWALERRTIKRHQEVHKPDYADKCINVLQGLVTNELPTKSLQVDVDVEQEVIEIASIKKKLISMRTGDSSNLQKSPKKLATSPVKVDLNDLSSEISETKECNTSDDLVRTSFAASGEAVAVVAATESRNNRNSSSQLWRCDKCPYSAHSIPRFKRHVFLHGRRLTYECVFCDYSVPNCWRLTEHRRLHLVKNQNLLHSQSVANLIFLPSRSLQSLEHGDSADVGEHLNLFEDSNDFSVPTFSPYRCPHCPFVSERRTEFHSHFRCHYVRSRHICPFCDFSTAASYLLLSHVLLHFSLPGCSTSSIPPKSREHPSWKLIIGDIEEFALKYSDDSGVSSVGSDTSGNYDLHLRPPNGKMMLDNDTHNKIDGGEGELVEQIGNHNARDGEKNANKQENVSTFSEDSIPVKAKCAESCGSTSTGNCNSSFLICRYCDRPFSMAKQLTKHEAGHLIGSCC